MLRERERETHPGRSSDWCRTALYRMAIVQDLERARADSPTIMERINTIVPYVSLSLGGFTYVPSGSTYASTHQVKQLHLKMFQWKQRIQT